MKKSSTLKLSKLLEDIKNGFSEIEGCFIKHPSLVDEIYFEDQYEKYLLISKRYKMPTLEEAEKEAEKSGKWKQSDQKSLDGFVKMLERSIESEKQVIEKMKAQMQEEIAKTSEKVNALRRQKTQAIGVTAESWAENKAYERYIWSLLYKNRELSKKIFEDFEYMEDSDIDKMFSVFLKFNEFTSSDNLKSLAVSVKCQNYFFISGESKSFFGKNTLELTHLQKDLFILLKVYSSIMQDMSGKVPQENLQDWKKIEEWRDGNERTREAMGDKSKTFSYDKIKNSVKKNGTMDRNTANNI